jgi:hypothetical protein
MLLTWVQRKGGRRGSRRRLSGRLPVCLLLLRPRRRKASASDVAGCGTSSSSLCRSACLLSSLLSPFSLSPFFLSPPSPSPLSPNAPAQMNGPNFHDWSIVRSQPGVRVEGQSKGIPELCHTRCTYRQRSAGTCVRALVQYAQLCDWVAALGISGAAPLHARSAGS